MKWLKIGRMKIMLILAIAAFSTHLLPLCISQWPFNNDGITECSIASDILASQGLTYPEGRFYVDTHSVITPAYNLLIAFVSSVVGASPFDVAQITVAAISVTTVIGGYAIAVRISNSVKGGIAAAATLTLLGTFVFLTGSTWKASLGVALLMLLVYSYVNRSEKRMLILEIVILCILPIVHHLVAGIAILMMWFLAIWALAYAIANAGVRRRHLIDFSVVSVISIGVLLYYGLTSHDRLNIVGSTDSLAIVVALFAGLGLFAYTVLKERESHLRHSTAPIVATAVFAAVFIDFFDPFYIDAPGSPIWVLVLAGATSVVIGIGWFGVETLLKRGSKYRAIPIGMLIPVATIIAFSLFAETGVRSHWMIYRTFDFADIPIAMGVAVAFAHFRGRFRAERALAVCLITVLLISFPFAYFTGPLEGIRHDTQDYEVDATDWASTHVGTHVLLQTDERLAYNARALYDFIKSPNLPGILFDYETPARADYCLLLEEWFTLGVNDYPRGHPIIDESYGREVISASDVFYIGGPHDNSLILFSVTSIRIPYALE